jgi:hypothetical protein
LALDAAFFSPQLMRVVLPPVCASLYARAVRIQGHSSLLRCALFIRCDVVLLIVLIFEHEGEREDALLGLCIYFIVTNIG